MDLQGLSALVKPCRKGHDAGRYADGRCRQCRSDAGKRRYAKHKDAIKARIYTYNRRQAATRSATLRRYYLRNREALIAKSMAWIKANPERHRELSARSRRNMRGHGRWIREMRNST